MSRGRVYGFGLAAAAALGAWLGISSASAGFAAHPGWPSRGPNCAPVAGTVGEFPLWLGHFTGGRFDGEPGLGAALNWQNRYSCFPSLQACKVWQREMRTAFRQIEGYRTCLPIR
jgi:hypothetical protein